ncbi:MAG: glycosyltransferase [Holophagaceae bacterium]
MSPRICVLIPAYNRADLIGRAIGSVLASDYPDLRVIVSDNGSTDGCLAAARSAAGGDPRFEFIAHHENRGPLPNWRSCLEAAKGDLVHWLWSDDWVEPAFYTTLVEGMEAQGAQMALCRPKIVSASEGWERISACPEGPRHEARTLLTAAVRRNALPVSPAAYLLPLEAVLRNFCDDIPTIGDLDCTRRAIGADLLMILGSLRASQAVYVHGEPLVSFNAHEASISVTSGARLLEGHYAWAKAWWCRRMGLPRFWSLKDVRRLWRGGHRRAALWALRGGL